MVYGATSSKYHVPNFGDVEAIANGSADVFSEPVKLCSREVQMVFVRTVFLVVSAQLLTIATIGHVIMFNPPFAEWVENSNWLWALIISMALLGGLVLYRLWMMYGELSRTAKWTNLWVYTFCQGIFLGGLLAKFNFRFGLVIVMFAFAAGLGIIVFTFQKLYNFEGLGPFVFAIVPILASTTIILSSYWQHNPWLITAPVFLSFLIISFPIVELYYLMSELTPDDDLVAPVYFGVDLIFPFRALHHICELTDRIHWLAIGEDEGGV
jgi:FtsH-binding integral membrane protein